MREGEGSNTIAVLCVLHCHRVHLDKCMCVVSHALSTTHTSRPCTHVCMYNVTYMYNSLPS